MRYNTIMEEKSKHAPYLTAAQKDQIFTWIRAGYTAPQIVGMAKNQGFHVTEKNIWNNYTPQVRKDFAEHIYNHELHKSWFNKEYRAQKAAEIAEMLYDHIMNGEMFQKEVIETPTKNGIQTTERPVYFAGMIKNWKDLVDTISSELGQRKQQLDVTFNKNQNLNLSVLVDKIYEQDNSVDKQIEGAEIIDLPSPSDFSDEKGFMQIVDEQTAPEVKELTENKDDDDSDLF